MSSPSIAPWWKSALARGFWLAAVAVTLYSVAASVPQFASQLRTLCAGSACEYQQLTYGQAATLRGLGLSVESYVRVTMALAALTLVVCLATSAIIIWRKPGDRMAVLVALLLATFGPVSWIASLPPGPNLWIEPQFYMPQLNTALFAVVFSLFPTGHFAPRWLRWGVIFLIVLGPATVFAISDTPLLANAAASRLGWLEALGVFVTLMVAQIYRYRFVSTPIERQQTKWVIVGLTVAVAVVGVGTAVILGASALGVTSDIFALFYNESGILIALLVSVGFGFAVMRYRLWEIDALINRALVYGALTLILTALYAGLVIGLQALSRRVIGQDNSVSIVLSTLVIAALVLPLRRWLQAFIDRQFYRRKYDAAQTLQAFSASLRHEFQVEALREQLLEVVDEAMRPAHVSLWLRSQPPEG